MATGGAANDARSFDRLTTTEQAVARRYERFKEASELPMALLALALGVLLVVPVMFNVSPATESLLDQVGWLIWGIFVFEYLALLWLAPDKWTMVRTHPIELLLVLVPVLRPLRILRLFQGIAGLGIAAQSMRRMFARTGFHWFLALSTSVIFLCALATFGFEQGHEDAQITTLAEAFWWAIVTCTTVGYGDYAPVSPGGRGVAVVLLLLGVSLISVITANIASYLIEDDAADEHAELMRRLDELHDRLDELTSNR